MGYEYFRRAGPSGNIGKLSVVSYVLKMTSEGKSARAT
jgi:hypothetical protein